MIYCNVFFGMLPAAPTPFQTHTTSLSESPVSVLAQAQTYIPTLNTESTLSNSRDLVAGRSIEVEKERKVRWQQRHHQEFFWDIYPEDGYLGLGYPNKPRFVISQVSDHLKTTSPLEPVKSSTGFA
jgi:hypothetical protein